jgi:hypothetical protein
VIKLKRSPWRHGTRFFLTIGAMTALSAVFAVAGASANAGPSVVHGSGDLSGVVLECSTDTVVLSGSYRYTESGFVNQLGNGTWFSRGTLSFDLAGVLGTGASGVSYRLVGATSVGYAFFFGATSSGIDVEHWTQTWLLLPQSGGPPLSFRETFVLVVMPNGSSTVVVHAPTDCD